MKQIIKDKMAKRKNTELFVRQAKSKHGDKYNYDKVKYVNNCTKVTIYCKNCDKHFSQRPMAHLSGQGCRDCGYKTLANDNKRTKEEFIEKAKSVHGDKYNYEQSEYINRKTKISIHCKDCDKTFYQVPSSHLVGDGCKSCGIKSRASKCRYTTEMFIEKAKSIHGDKYNYDQVKYIGSQAKVSIFCIKCNKMFSQDAETHLMGRGCRNCGTKTSGSKRSLTKEMFIEKAKSVHGDNYNYDQVNYVNNHTKVIIYCKKCEDTFSQVPSSHLLGSGCPYHANKTELKLHYYLIEKKYEVKREHKFEDFKKSKFDFYLPDYNLVIELDGDQHFRQVRNWSKPKVTQTKDKLKMDYCLKNGISMIRLLQDDVFNDRYDWKAELVKYIKVYDKPIVKMLEKNNLYDVFEDYKQYDPDLI